MNASGFHGTGSGLLVGAVMGVVALGQNLVRRDFFREVTREPVQFPITLKPYRWMVIGSHVFSVFILIFALALIIFFPGRASHYVGAAMMVMFSLVWLSVFRGSRQEIRIDRRGFSYVKNAGCSIDVKADEISLFFAPPIGGTIVIGLKGKPKRLVIPMMFRDMHLLRHFLSKWQKESSLN